MTIIRYTPKFKKQYKKLPTKLQKQFDDRLKLFIANPLHPQLRRHSLTGKYNGYWSLNVTGDVRALYLQQGCDVIVFVLIGSHSRLYG